MDQICVHIINYRKIYIICKTENLSHAGNPNSVQISSFKITLPVSMPKICINLTDYLVVSTQHSSKSNQEPMRASRTLSLAAPSIILRYNFETPRNLIRPTVQNQWTHLPPRSRKKTHRYGTRLNIFKVQLNLDDVAAVSISQWGPFSLRRFSRKVANKKWPTMVCAGLSRLIEKLKNIYVLRYDMTMSTYTYLYFLER